MLVPWIPLMRDFTVYLLQLIPWFRQRCRRKCCFLSHRNGITLPQLLLSFFLSHSFPSHFHRSHPRRFRRFSLLLIRSSSPSNDAAILLCGCAVSCRRRRSVGNRRTLFHGYYQWWVSEWKIFSSVGPSVCVSVTCFSYSSTSDDEKYRDQRGSNEWANAYINYAYINYIGIYNI